MSHHRNGPNPATWNTTGWVTFSLIFFGGWALLTGGEFGLPNQTNTDEPFHSDHLTGEEFTGSV